MVFEELADEVIGSLCGLPPGTITAASAVMGAISSDNSKAAKQTVENNTDGLTEEEKRIVRFATINLAHTAKRDHPRASTKRCIVFAMNTLILADKMYSPSGMRRVLQDAVQPQHSKCRKVMITVQKDYRRKYA